MPQIKSQKKRVKTNDKRHQAVVAQKSALKTAIKKVLAAVEANDKELAALHTEKPAPSWTRQWSGGSTTEIMPFVRNHV